MKKLIKLVAVGLFAAAIIITPSTLRAADGDTPAASASTRALPFHGKVASVDATANTVTVGKRTFKVADDTRITKDGQDAKLSDVTVGQNISGSYKKAGDGTLTANSLNLTPPHKKKKDAEAAQ